MTALIGRKADIYYTSGAAVAYSGNNAMSDISATVAGQAVRTAYAVSVAAQRYFDQTQALVFQRSLDSGVTWNAVTPDTIAPGFIVFNASQQAAPVAQFRVLSGWYLPFGRLGGGKEWVLSPAIDMWDVTEFSNTSKHHVAAVTSYKVQLKRWWLDDAIRSLNGTKFVLALWLDATTQPAGPRYEIAVAMKGDSIKTPVKGVIEEQAINFESESDAWLLTS